DANGVEHVRPLATVVGNGNITSLQDTVETVTQVVHPEYKITTAGYETPTFTEMPPVLPITSRRSLERAAARAGYSTPGYGNLPAEQLRRLEADRMPMLRENPKARIQLGDALNWHMRITNKKDPEYARTIEAVVGATPRMEALADGTKA